MINKIKETLSQVFFSPEASGAWEEKIECAIDDVTVKCEDLEAPIQECGPGHFTQGYGFFGYTGVPAPRVLEDDEWFGSAPVSDENKEYEHINDDPQYTCDLLTSIINHPSSIIYHLSSRWAPEMSVPSRAVADMVAE